MSIRELRDGAGGLEEEEQEREEEARSGGGGEVAAVARLRAKRALVGAGARVLFYPTLLYNVLRNRFEAEFRWWDRVDKYVLLGAVPFSSDVPRLKQLGVKGVVTLNEPYETLVSTSLYQAHGINHLEIPTRDYLFAPSLEHICQAVDFIHRNEMQGGSTYVHCKAGRGRSTTIVLCFLIKYRNMTPEAALDHARSVRPRVLLAPSQWQAVKLFSTVTSRCLSIQSSNGTCSVQSEKESSELFSTLTTRCLWIECSNEDSSVTSDEESSEASVADPEVDGYTTEFDSEHFVLPRCRSLLSRPTSPTGGSDAVFITEADLEGYGTYADAGKDVVSVDVVVRHKPIMRKLSCFLGSLKLTLNCEPPPSRLTEVRAC
ncbi:phosphatidylglycerophosphate phosphatase PTPMT2-like [Phragmites australis]|uniref:phosphatidylglycerophosphate phosphatase PTPMT2-like n=1 Tax=Phragmites australis TaxID=29695 RepID=UPI002D793510|nr:phosphatidylglycerophosphate phosphatase PTPMT2-like [Phragmites australis]